MFLAFLSFASSQDLTLNCLYLNTPYDEYACLLMNIEVLNETQNVIIGGEHMEGKTEADIEVVVIADSNTPFMIQQIFTTFPNMLELEIYNSSLQSVNVPPSANLIWLDLSLNNILRLERGGFRNQTDLAFLFLVSDNIREIDEDAFEDIGNLFFLILIGNVIEEIAPRTFDPLTELMILDMEGNSLTRIDEGIFSPMRNLVYLFLDFNQINAIHPRFVADLIGILEYIDLKGNLCINRSFEIDDDAGVAQMNNALNTCFNNFNGTSPSDIRRITLEFVGNLALFDEFGNLIVRI